MTTIRYKNDKNRSFEEAEGSDGRLNVSSRADSRAYYNSRDEGQTFSLLWDDADAAAGDLVCVWKNLRTDGKHLVISSIGINASLVSTVSVVFVSGTAAGGSVLTPTNLNATSPNDAPDGSARGNSALSGLTELAEIDHAAVGANGHEELRIDDRVRLGQNNSIAIKYETGSNGRCYGIIFGYYE